MVVDKEEKYLAFRSHHNRARCLDGGRHFPQEWRATAAPCAAEALSPVLMKCWLHLTQHRGACWHPWSWWH